MRVPQPIFHPHATTVRAAGGHGARARRIAVTPQDSYWRSTAVELHSATPPVSVNAAGLAASFAGPAAVGEVWQVTTVQVQVQPSLLAVPCSAQIWRGVGGVTQNLLFLTNQGGYDDVGVTGQPIRAGEQIIVIWEGAHPGDSAWATIEGFKTVLEAYSGDA